MKKILITGANSYIGTSFEKYMAQWPEKYQVDTVDMIDGTWREKSFAGYDCVYHVAGIAHSDSGKISPEKAKLYYAVNTDLTIETAKKAKAEGMKQFIFMSSAIVYGESAPIGKSKVITKDTPVSPANSYGDSKVQAENGILPLNDDTFKVVILRPPMIYGPSSKGNYPVLSKLAQNAEYSNTTELVKLIAQAHGKKIAVIPGSTWALKLLSHCTGLVNKAFGSLSYEQGISKYRDNYCVASLKDSIGQTEK